MNYKSRNTIYAIDWKTYLGYINYISIENVSTYIKNTTTELHC